MADKALVAGTVLLGGYVAYRALGAGSDESVTRTRADGGGGFAVLGLPDVQTLPMPSFDFTALADAFRAPIYDAPANTGMGNITTGGVPPTVSKKESFAVTDSGIPAAPHSKVVKFGGGSFSGSGSGGSWSGSSGGSSVTRSSGGSGGGVTTFSVRDSGIPAAPHSSAKKVTVERSTPQKNANASTVIRSIENARESSTPATKKSTPSSSGSVFKSIIKSFTRVFKRW